MPEVVTMAPAATVRTATAEIPGRSITPRIVIHTPTAIKNAGSSGYAKLTTPSFCQPGRRRKMKNEPTESTAKKLSSSPM